MIRKTKFIVDHPVFIDKNHTEIPVKIHGYLFGILPGNVADRLHDEKVAKPYSIEYHYGMEKDVLIINTLNGLAEEIPAALVKKGEIIIHGAKEACGARFYQTVEYSEEKVKVLSKNNYLKIRFLSPAVYRNGYYSCWFDLDQLVRNSREKLAGYCQKHFSFDRPLMEQIRIVNYQLKTVPFFVNSRINGISGEMKLSLEEAVNKNEILELLSYCEFTGLGAKTALGMGAIKVF